MTTRQHAEHRRQHSQMFPVLMVVLTSGVGFLVLTPFGWVAWNVGPLLVAVSHYGRCQRRAWAAWLLRIGTGLTLGVLLHVVVELLTPDGPAAGSGSGTAVP